MFRTLAHLAFFKAKNQAQPVGAALIEFISRSSKPTLAEVESFLRLYSGGTGHVGERVVKRAVISRNYCSHYVDEVSTVLRRFKQKPATERTLQQLYNDLCTIQIAEKDSNGYLASFLYSFAQRANFDEFSSLTNAPVQLV